MRVITEIELRDEYKKAPFTSFKLPEGCRLTPSAAQFLSERKIEVITGQQAQANRIVKSETTRKNNSGSGNEKPEHMTHLRGTELVLKSHPVIKYRGKLDTFEALLLSTVLDAESAGFHELARDLQDTLDYSRQVMRAEVKIEHLAQIKIRGWSPQEIRERSHYLKKYYDINHFTPQPGHGRLIAQLNYLRTQARELELSAIDAFCSDEKVEREDILQALNRFSSLIYIFMAQLLSGHYKIGR
jgi:ethanolamine utilization cobalamin adenosyltransferase